MKNTENNSYILNIVKDCGLAIIFSNPNNLKQQNIMLAAIKNNADAYLFADYSLQNDYYFALQAIKVNSEVLANIPDKIYNNKNWQIDAGLLL